MDDDKTSLKEVVAAYLRKHPDFLDDFPDILEELQLDHASGVASSLNTFPYKKTHTPWQY